MVRISVTAAQVELLEVIRRAQEAGEEVVLTHEGAAEALLVPLHRRRSAESRKAALEAWRAAGAGATPGPSAARSQDFLYDENGLPA